MLIHSNLPKISLVSIEWLKEDKVSSQRNLDITKDLPVNKKYHDLNLTDLMTLSLTPMVNMIKLSPNEQDLVIKLSVVEDKLE